MEPLSTRSSPGVALSSSLGINFFNGFVFDSSLAYILITSIETSLIKRLQVGLQLFFLPRLESSD